jgi:hypothetical protein
MGKGQQLASVASIKLHLEVSEQLTCGISLSHTNS